MGGCMGACGLRIHLGEGETFAVQAMVSNYRITANRLAHGVLQPLRSR